MTMKSFHSKSLNKRSKTNPIEDYEDYGKSSQGERANRFYTESTGFSGGKTSFGLTHQKDDSQVKLGSSGIKQKAMTNFFTKSSKRELSKTQTIVV